LCVLQFGKPLKIYQILSDLGEIKQKTERLLVISEIVKNMLFNFPY